MKTPKIVNAMNHIDDELIVSANKMPAHRTQPSGVKWAALAAALLIAIAGVFAVARIVVQNTVDAIVALDVNPSVELEINADEEVIGVYALNRDAEIILGDMDLMRVDIDVAVNALIGSMLKNGYLSVDQNSVLVSVSSADGAKAEALQNAIAGDIAAVLGASNIEASVIAQRYEKDDATARKAEENQISAAKAALIEKIVASGLRDAHDVPYSYETLAHMSVNELKMLLESKQVEVGGVESSGTARNDSYIEKSRALGIAFVHAGLSENENDAAVYAVVKHMHVELDYEDGIMVYSVEFDTDEFEYEYEINAKTGEIKKAAKEENDDRFDDKNDDRHDKDDNKNDDPPADSDIGREKALALALIHAGLAKDEADASSVKGVFEVDVESERENGVMVYKVDFETREFEYEYEINAKTGEILKVETEPQDD